VRIVNVFAISALLVALPAQAKLPFVKKAQELGFKEVTSCQSCHVDKLPKKGANQHNERGQFLVRVMAEKKAAEVDLTWLKDYKGR